MEDDKKKKKNKKKKNKQTKTTVDVAHGIGESANADQNHVIEQNHHNQVLESTDGQNDVQKDVDLDRHHTNGTEGSVLVEAEKLYWMDREASLEETIKKLQKETDSCIQKEASLEETIKQLQNENDTHKQKEASLETKLLQLQSEKDYWLQKEAGFEEKINQLIDETATLSLKGVSLEEKVKQLERERDFWLQKENSTKETIASLNGDNTRLQAQVMALEESRNILSEENQQLIESMFGLQSQIQNLEKSTASTRTSTVMTTHASGSEDMNAEMEAARQLVEKLAAENAELVEKVNEFYVDLDRRGATADRSSAVESEVTVGTAETVGVPDPMSELSEGTSASGERMDSPNHVVIKDERNGGDNVNPKDTACVADPMSESSERTSPSGKRRESQEDVAIEAEGEGDQYNYAKDDSTTVIPNSPEIMDSEEIVQIPLDENEVGDPGLQAMATHDEEKTGVPLTDAPLIGAPFRLISFFARYVSGADLVNKSSAESGTVNSHN